MEKQRRVLELTLMVNALALWLYSKGKAFETPSSLLGDPGMGRDGLRVAFEAWNFCNEVGQESPSMGSPRAADCFDLRPNTNTNTNTTHSDSDSDSDSGFINYSLDQKVDEAVNKLGIGKPMPGYAMNPSALFNPDLYAVEKELYLGSLCQVQDDSPFPWQFWMIMLKNGNYDTKSGLCPKNGKKVPPFKPGRFPCFGVGCMNQPDLYHDPTILSRNGTMRGSFRGTYDQLKNSTNMSLMSYFEVVWEKKVGIGSWVFRHKLKTSKKYPWLMLYLRADATKGFSGGYHYDTRGMLNILPESPNFKVKLTLNVIHGGGSKSQFYLIDMGSCWKNNGSPCNGDVLTDVTRYSEMIINPNIQPWCRPRALQNCPPYHVTPNHTKIHRTDTAHFPYKAYHYYCGPGNARHLEKPYSICDPFSNPQAQELVQLLPHPVWAQYGFPSKKGDGWIGNPRTWELDVGALSARLYFYQDPGTEPAKRVWTSLDVGTEIFVSKKDETAEWILSDFDVINTSPGIYNV